MTSKTEQFYIRRIAKLEKQVAELVEINETFVKKNAEHHRITFLITRGISNRLFFLSD